ncbi:MAG: tRNA (guanosine(46)-N7)-methyltransferase TrmB [Haliscomenobacter sp.]|uniref:tRNA (guanosine(46)-N7)-methyltransferase TrmB n=1 Tax=Haliscomenobacter sp. TaxID=2717303 RepID=UPI0029B3F846|nr:tRNA (guanosine(46)-N7)-methyltransferase TrmB [Haliscomenobacter sp.]MDX2071193.1 tRNA (guanosine(46)-N7)-methyltransferase TrmB [Haliscomenobacter sp.]
MSKRNKLQKFAELLSFPNVYENFDSGNPQLAGENGQIVDLKGQWKAGHFKNDAPLTLELACGRGEYSVALGEMYPERNFIGVDIKGARIWKGATAALQKGLPNVAFLRTRIEQIMHFFAEGEVDEIWITFPDPFLRNSKTNRRLTSPAFLDRYRKMMPAGGIVHLKTDDPTLYEFTLTVIRDYPEATLLYTDDDIYAKELPLPELEIKTYYERMHLAEKKTIKYVQFRLS